MFLSIAGMLQQGEVESLQARLQGQQFVSGDVTAGSYARQVKNNEQTTSISSTEILKEVEKRLLAHPVFRAAAQPKTFVKLLVSRYRPGMHYGLHVDDAIMNGLRTDLSFTLFLSDPTSYEGGELVIEENDGDRAFKLPSGSLVLYPTTTLHRVSPVTAGERLVVVGWVRSMIRDGGNREILFDLENTIATLRDRKMEREIMDRLYKVRANLLRQWAED